MTEEQKKERFTYCNCPECVKHCAFYWQERDYYGEIDEGCYFGQFKPEFQPNTGLVCYLPSFIQKIIFRKLLRKEVDDFAERCEENSEGATE